MVRTGGYIGAGFDSVLWKNPTTGNIGYRKTNNLGQVTGFDDLGSAITAYHTIPPASG